MASQLSNPKQAPISSQDDDEELDNAIVFESSKPSQAQSPNDNDEKRERRITGVPWAILVVAVLSSTGLYAFDNTVMANVRPSIIDTFPGSVSMLPWMSVSYPMGEVGCAPLWGKLYGQFNNKYLFLAALLAFEVGSAVIGSAQSVRALIAGRAVAGFGGSGIYVGTINIVSGVTVHAERSQYLGLVGVAWGLGTMLGPIVGGAFADSPATWRWAFYINLCIAAVTAPACAYLIPVLRSAAQGSTWERIRRVDYLGAVLFLAGIVLVVMLLSFGGSMYGWSDGPMVAIYVATSVAWLAFVLQQTLSLFTHDRVFPVHLATSLETSLMFAWTANAISALVVPIYSLPLFFQFAFADSSVRSAALTLPSIVAAVVAAGAGGPLVAKFPVYKAWFAGGGAVMLVGSTLLTTIDHQTSRAAVCGYSVILGLGCGAMIQLPLTVTQVKSPRAQVSQATAFITCAQMGGLAIALGTSTCLFINLASADISNILPDAPPSTVQALIDGAGSHLLDEWEPAVQERVLAAIAQNVGVLFYLNVAGAALGLLSTLLMKWERLVLDA